MNTNPDSEQATPLLDAVLRDEDWQAASAALKAEALGVFHRRQRLRRVTRWTGWGLALVVAIAGAAHWLRPPPPAPRQAAVKPTEHESAHLRYLSDEELLAAFPKGSCMLVEVNDRKQLVFLDPKLEQVFMAKSE